MPLPLLAWAAIATTAAAVTAIAVYSSDDDSSNSKSKEDEIKRQQEKEQEQKRERQAKELSLKKQKASAFFEKHYTNVDALVKLKKEVHQAKNASEISIILNQANTQYMTSEVTELVRQKADLNQQKRKFLAAVTELKKIRGGE